MTDATRTFLELSAILTGYSRVELQGTGMAPAYYQTMTGILGGRLVGELLLAWETVRTDAGNDRQTLETLVEQRIVGDASLGPVAKNLIVLWYLGQWQQMPGDWRQVHGASSADLTHVVSPAAYREGLVWDAIHAHPMSAKQPGFGSWALPPRGVMS
jgi:hypothetical protein